MHIAHLETPCSIATRM